MSCYPAHIITIDTTDSIFAECCEKVLYVIGTLGVQYMCLVLKIISYICPLFIFFVALCLICGSVLMSGVEVGNRLFVVCRYLY